MCNLVTSAYVYKDKSKCLTWQHLEFGVFCMNEVFMSLGKMYPYSRADRNNRRWWFSTPIKLDKSITLLESLAFKHGFVHKSQLSTKNSNASL